MEMKPGYKQTEAGVIPEDWEVQPLLSAVRIASGQVSPRIEPYKSMILVAPDHIESSTGRLLSRVTAADQGAISGKYLFGPGDILYSKIRPYLCKATIANFSGLCSADMYPLAPAKGVSSGYMLAVILGHRFTKYAESVSVRSGMPKINREELSGFSIPIPPDQEQIRIAETLGDVDQLLDLLEGLIAKKQGIKQAAMQELLTGKRRLPGFEGEWEVKRLGEIAEITMGQSPNSHNYNRQARGLPLIQGNADIKNRESAPRIFTTQITKRGFNGDILMTVRAPVGEVSKANIDVCLGRGVCAIRFPNNFLYHFLVFLEPAWAKHSKGSTFDSVNAADIKAVDIHLPYESSEQNAIADVLSEMDDELAALEARRNKARALKQGMMQELLTGRTRLK
jgi:type I restriction enzyme, S subunit